MGIVWLLRIRIIERLTHFQFLQKSLLCNIIKLKNILLIFFFWISVQSPRFKNFGSSGNSLNPTLRPNSDDSLCYVIDSCKIFRSTVESCSLHKNPECANSYHENLSNRILNWFFELNSVEIRCSLNPKAQVVNKAKRQLQWRN